MQTTGGPVSDHPTDSVLDVEDDPTFDSTLSLALDAIEAALDSLAAAAASLIEAKAAIEWKAGIR